jgi:hypothetical protein
MQTVNLGGLDCTWPNFWSSLVVAACNRNQLGQQSALVFGQDYVQLSPGSGQDYLQLSLQSTAWASNRSPPARIRCD